MNPKFGLTKAEITEIIEKKFDDNADLLIGINDPEVAELINIIKDSFIEVTNRNNLKIQEQFNEAVEHYLLDTLKKAGIRTNL
jgi:uncharacterized protein YaaQ